jgi:hypothetical protein
LTCAVGTVAAGGKATVTINVKWTASGSVYDSASVTSDQINSAPAAQQSIAFGTAPANVSDGPIPPWAYISLAILMGLVSRRQLEQSARRLPR